MVYVGKERAFYAQHRGETAVLFGGLWFQQVMLFEMERMRPSFLFIRFKEY